MKKIIGIFICFLFISTIFIPLAISKNEYIFTKKNMTDDPILLNNYNDSNNVLIDLDINGLSYGQELLWKANTTGVNYEESAVAYIDGIAYIGSCSTHGGGHDKLFAVNTTNGNIIWSTYIGATYVGPVIDNDRIYIGSTSHGYDPTNDYVFCINRSDGKIIWSRKIYWSTPESIQYDDEKIYFASYSIFALDKNDGSIVWEYPLDDFSVTKPILKDNAIITATSGGKMYKVDARNGEKIWEVPIPDSSWDNSITADGKGHIFLAIFFDESINSYDEDTGELLWSYKLHDRCFSFNAYHDNILFISDLAGYVYAIDSNSGSLIWEKKIGNTCDICSPTLSGGLLFIGTRDFCEGAFYVLNETNGDILWKYHVGASITSPPSIVDGMMICGTDGWYMYAFDFGIGDDDWLLHRYDNCNTAYSPNGLTEWQFVSALCNKDDTNTNCIIKNTYDHKVDDVILKLPNGITADWYDNSGNLLKSESNFYIINELLSKSTSNIIISNYQENRPNKPKISGPKFGIPGIEYTYKFSTDDANNSEISYLVYWDDDKSIEWTPMISSYQTLELSHVWYQKKTYNIKAKVRNSQGIESEWSDSLPITMPYYHNQLYNKLKIILPNIRDSFFNNSIFQLPISKTWMKTFGGVKEDRGRCIQQTDDGGYIIAGNTYSFGAGSFDIWLTKLDSNGNKIWDKTFGGPSADLANSVKQTSDGGYIIAGSLSWDESLYLIKTDSNGDISWFNIFGGKGEEDGKSVLENVDGDFIILGYTNSFGAGNSDIWLIKTDNYGNMVWDKTFGGKSYDYGTSIEETLDNGFIITGYTNSFGEGNNDVWLIKTDKNGNELWNKTIGGVNEDRGYSVKQTNDEGYIITGFTYQSNSPDLLFAKTDRDGNLVWDKTFGGESSEHGNCVKQTGDNGFIITGWTESFGNDFSNVWLIKTDEDGNMVWDKTFGGNAMEVGDSVFQTSDGGYIITGGVMVHSGIDLLLIKTDINGKQKNMV